MTILQQFIQDRSPLFWSVKEQERVNVSEEVVVETILSYGEIADIVSLFDIIGKERVASIFKKQLARKRPNYHPRTINFFNLYFERYAS